MVPTPSATDAIRLALQQRARRHGDRLAIIDRRETVTFAQLWQRARALAARHEPRPGAVVTIASTSTVAFFIRVAAVWLNDAVPMPADAKMSPPRRTSGTRATSMASTTAGRGRP
ncbi:AMP-binding protein [Nucisporomicrobium flavum]|uniref:AMP-binding protein n=1 Tax=Nucisporomicrobium flavum TaxID=2785915 RepID=UPI003558477F